MRDSARTPEQGPKAPDAPAETLCTHPSASPPKDPLLGTVVGSFRLIRKLGGGGMGTVYLGEHTLIGSKVAVKFLHEHFASNEALVQRFLAEARAVNLIGHENIVNIFDMNVLPPKRHYLVMEYLEGQPLSARLRQPMAPSEAVGILTQVCDALQAAHSHGVIHRDLKPENIFLLRRERMPHFVKVLDFGIAKLLDRNLAPAQTALGTLMGTPEYMAPEQWTGHPVDGRTDLYALGVIAYRLLTGHRAFHGEGLAELLQAHLNHVPLSPHGVDPAIPAALSDVVMRALAKRPEDRFKDAAELRAALERSLSQGSVAQPVSSRPVRHSAPGPRSTPPLPTGPSSRPPEPRPSEASAQVVLSPKADKVRMACSDLSRAGTFLCTNGVLPPLRSRVPLTLELRGQHLPCTGEVVRHVTPAQAAAWGMCAGFAIQFVELSAEVRDTLAVMLQGQTPTPVKPSPLRPDDPRADSLLEQLQQRMSSDPYTLLGLPHDATFDAVRQSVRNLQRSVEAIAARPLSDRQAHSLDELRTRIEKSSNLLSQPQLRIGHDASRANFAGVARCIAGGLTASELESLRARYLLARPGTEVRERIHATTASSWESQGKIDLALAEYEKALTADPLNLQLHQRYWNLKRRDPRPAAASTPTPARVEPPSWGPATPEPSTRWP